MKFKTLGLILLFLFVSGLFFSNGSVFSTEIQEIEWHSYDNGMARGKFEKKRVFLHFTAAWCYYCGVMDNKTFKDPAVISALNEKFIAIKVDYDKERNTSSFYRVQGLPDTIFIAEDGEIIGRRPGYIPTEQLKLILESILAKRKKK